MAEPYIRVEDVTFLYPGSSVAALDGVSLSIAEGEFACILGPSGCGKSTLLALLSGLAVPERGRIEVARTPLAVDGRRVASQSPRCGYVFQDARLMPWRTVRRNITLALAAEGTPKAEWDGIVRRQLRMLHLEQFADAWPLNLSGGQRQRVAIARALAVDPTFLLMDEPFSTLDEVTARVMREELLRIWREQDPPLTVVFVTHSIREAVYLADTIYVLSRGPGRLLGARRIDIPRPRQYEDPRVNEIEREIVAEVLREWGVGQDSEVEPVAGG